MRTLTFLTLNIFLHAQERVWHSERKGNKEKKNTIGLVEVPQLSSDSDETLLENY